MPFCTFDYRVFCEGLLAQTRARFLQRGGDRVRPDGAVMTTEGRFTAPVVVDCSGWRGAVVQDGAPDATTGDYSFGLETHTALDDEGLSFLLDRSLIPHGLGWIFPVGEGSLIGLGSYVGRSKLRPALDRLPARSGHRRRAPTTARTSRTASCAPPSAGVFAVGDAAGQCLPLTAEGIRPAIYFGSECGRIVQRVLDGALSLERGLEQLPPARRALPAARTGSSAGCSGWPRTRRRGWFAALTELAAHQSDPAALVAAVRLVRPAWTPPRRPPRHDREPPEPRKRISDDAMGELIARAPVAPRGGRERARRGRLRLARPDRRARPTASSSGSTSTSTS